MLSQFCVDICPWADIAVALRCLRMGKIDVITHDYVIIYTKQPIKLIAFCTDLM